MTPLYTRPAPADPGEVERLQRRIRNADLALKVQAQNCDTLREENKRMASACQQTLKEMSACEAENERLRAQLDVLLRGAAHLAKRVHQSSLGTRRQALAELLAFLAGASARAEPSAPTALIPEGYCIMPRRLTAENGAKTLLLGKFKLEVTHECPECHELEEPAEGCEICDGEGEYGQRYVIPWDKIKFIYSEAVKGLALKPDATSKPSLPLEYIRTPFAVTPLPSIHCRDMAAKAKLCLKQRNARSCSAGIWSAPF